MVCEYAACRRNRDKSFTRILASIVFTDYSYRLLSLEWACIKVRHPLLSTERRLLADNCPEGD